MPLGLLPEMTYEEIEVHLAPGDGLFLYTDGIVEAHNEGHEMFGLPRLHEILEKVAFGSEMIDDLLARMAEFTGPNWEQEDDVTFVILTCSAID